MARGKKRVQADPSNVVGYLRVSTEEQGHSGLGLAAQRATIEAEAERRGWTVIGWHVDSGLSGKTLDRPALTAALADVEEGRAAALVAAKLDRLTRSVAGAAALLERAQRGGWAVVALDVGVDTTSASGEAMASMMSVFAQLERRLICDRTKAALAVKKAQGVTLGRPRTMPATVVGRIVAERETGEGWSGIARGLNADAVPTAHGGACWHPATVRKAYLGTVG